MEGGELKRQRRESSIQVTQGDATLVQDSVAQIFFVLLLCKVFFLSSFFSFFLQKKIVGLFFFFKILPKKVFFFFRFFFRVVVLLLHTFDFATLREKKTTRNTHTPLRDERST